MSIIRQELLPEGIRQAHTDGRVEIVPYLRDENGEEYVDVTSYTRKDNGDRIDE